MFQLLYVANNLDRTNFRDDEIFGIFIYPPISEAIKDNNVEVIEYLENCNLNDRRLIGGTVASGLKDLNIKNENEIPTDYMRTVNLWQSICNENGGKEKGWNFNEIFKDYIWQHDTTIEEAIARGIRKGYSITCPLCETPNQIADLYSYCGICAWQWDGDIDNPDCDLNVNGVSLNEAKKKQKNGVPWWE